MVRHAGLEPAKPQRWQRCVRPVTPMAQQQNFKKQRGFREATIKITLETLARLFLALDLWLYGSQAFRPLSDSVYPVLSGACVLPFGGNQLTRRIFR